METAVAELEPELGAAMRKQREQRNERETERGRTSAELGALTSILKQQHSRQAAEAARGHDRGTGGKDEHD
jgi:hypothetical protein